MWGLGVTGDGEDSVRTGEECLVVMVRTVWGLVRSVWCLALPGRAGDTGRPVSWRVNSGPSTCELLPAHHSRYSSLTSTLSTPEKCSNPRLPRTCSRRADITMICRRRSYPGTATLSTSPSSQPALTVPWTTSVSAWRMTSLSLRSDKTPNLETSPCQVRPPPSQPVLSSRPLISALQTSAAARYGRGQPPTPAHPSNTVRGTGVQASTEAPASRPTTPSSTSSRQCSSHTSSGWVPVSTLSRLSSLLPERRGSVVLDTWWEGFQGIILIIITTVSGDVGVSPLHYCIASHANMTWPLMTPDNGQWWPLAWQLSELVIVTIMIQTNSHKNISD